MKPMKFFNSWKDYFSKKNIFKHRKNPQSSNILIFAIFFAYYNRLHQSINWIAIEILINLENGLKLSGYFFCKGGPSLK